MLLVTIISKDKTQTKRYLESRRKKIMMTTPLIYLNVRLYRASDLIQQISPECKWFHDPYS